MAARKSRSKKACGGDVIDRYLWLTRELERLVAQTQRAQAGGHLLQACALFGRAQELQCELRLFEKDYRPLETSGSDAADGPRH
jgi:hypothetical protein